MTRNSAIIGGASIPAAGSDAGIQVAAFGPYGSASSLTDDNGYFIISGLSNGTYFLEYSKEGYGTVRQYNIQVFGNDTARAYITQLYEKPSDKKLPVLKKAYIGLRPRSSSEKLWICIDTDVTSQKYNEFCMQFMLCMDTDEKVSWNKNKLIDFTWIWQNNGGNYSLYIDPDYYFQIGQFPFKKGDKVYVRGYPCNKSESSGYLDTYLGTRQYSTLDITRSTNVVSFVVE